MSDFKAVEKSQRAEGRMRVLTWNLDHNPYQRSERIVWAAEVINRVRPDVLCVQEGDTEALEDLSFLTKMSVVSSRDDKEAVLTNHKIVTSFSENLPEGSHGGIAGAVLDTGCHKFAIASTHLCWGSGLESVRSRQTVHIDKLFDSYASIEPFRTGGNEVIGVLTGDLNSEIGSDSLRYLLGMGVIDGRSTLWTDAWVRGEGSGITSSTLNPLADRTAASVGLHAEGVIPERRIDYILIRGFAYRRPGAPLSSEIVGLNAGEITPSDHYGVLSELLC
jgi:endonuclease/exonuclease/phosphatase family metal-dependent hydrolase